MELRISDLLDELQEVPIDILPYTAASKKRVNELTLRKIHEHGNPKNHTRSSHVISKVLIAAVLITALAFTVMAATGTQFEDWIVGLEKPKEGQYSQYDSELLLGGTSYHWEVSNWMLLLTAADATENGITLEAMEYGNGMKHGTLTMDGAWWLESWNGSGYEAMAITIPAGEQVNIEPQGKYRWKVDWSRSYGSLESGSYRLGIPLTYTAEDGTKEEVEFYAKFRIFSEEMKGYIDKCNDALKARYEQEVLHFKETHYPHNTSIRNELGYVYYTEEVWKYGNDFLSALRYYDENGVWIEDYGGGHLCRDGVGYTLNWTDETLSEVSQWERASYVEDDDVSYGMFLRAEVIEPIIGEIWDDGNTIYMVSFYDGMDETLLTEEELQQLNEENPLWNYNYNEYVYTFDDSGNLTGYESIAQTAKSAENSKRETTYKFEIYDTAPEEVQRMIRMHDVSNPPAFSWKDEQSLYGEMVDNLDFRNTTAQKITCADDAVDIARKDAVITEHPRYREGDEYNLAQAFYDESADVWKIVFGYSQEDNKQIYVYLSGDGITLMTVYPPAP